MKRYEVRWAALDPAAGAEMAKTRPAVIVSLDVLNERLATVTVCPLTSQLHPGWRTRLPARVGRRNAEIAVDQIRTISKSRLGKKLGSDSSHWRRVKKGMPDRYRLFFRFASNPVKVIVYVWFNDENTVRKVGSKTDVYEAFTRLLVRGVVPSDIDALLREARE